MEWNEREGTGARYLAIHIAVGFGFGFGYLFLVLSVKSGLVELK